MSSTAPSQARFWRHFRLLWTGQLLSALGDRLHALALVWLAVQYGGERAGWIVAAGAAGRLVFGLIGGAYADRLDRQRVMIVTDLLCALAVASLLALDFSQPGALWWLAAVSFCVGALDSFFQPALQASLPALAPDPSSLQTANAWLDVNRRLAMAVGPAATGLLLLAMPLTYFFALDALTFIASALAIAALGRGYAWRAETNERGTNLVRDIASGMREAFAHRTLTWGVGQNAVWNLVLTPALSVGATLLVQQELGAGPEWLGYVLAAYGVGNVASNLVLTRLPVRNTARTLFAGAVVAGAGWTAFAMTTEPLLLLLVTALTACGGPMTDLMLLRMIQTDFPRDRVGRVFSLRTTVSRSAGAVGLALAVPWYGLLGTRPAIAAGGLVLVCFALLGLWRHERHAAVTSAS